MAINCNQARYRVPRNQGIRIRMNPKVDGYLREAKKSQEEMEKLRMIILGKRNPTLARIGKLADALEVSASELLK